MTWNPLKTIELVLYFWTPQVTYIMFILYMHSLCCTLMDFDIFFNILTTTLILYIATICKPV